MWEVSNQEKNLHLIIEHDEYVGYYLYVCEFQSDKAYQDYLCDNLEQAYVEAEMRFGIDKKEFKEIK